MTLSTGFISARANTVISTLWAVSDLATAFLTIFYYRYRQAGNRPAIALQKAQCKLRTISGETIKASYYQELNQHLKNYENLYSDKAHATQNKEQKKTWDSYSSKAGKMRRSLEIMLKESTPFAAPHYWAGFIHLRPGLLHCPSCPLPHPTIGQASSAKVKAKSNGCLGSKRERISAYFIEIDRLRSRYEWKIASRQKRCWEKMVLPHNIIHC